MKNKINLKSNFAILLLLLNISACASTKTTKTIKPEKEESVISSAASQPFKDFGFMKKNVPPILSQITDPYAMPEGADCAWIKYQVTELDNVLGPDAYRGSTFDDSSMSEKGEKAIKGAAKDAVKGAFSDLIPGRGYVRKLSGAEKADKAYSNAVNLGNIRRGFLKGVSHTKNCN